MICPICRSHNDPALSPSGRLPPQDWHPIVCVDCHSIVVIDHAWPGELRPPSEEDWDAWSTDPKIADRLIRTLTALRKDSQT